MISAVVWGASAKHSRGQKVGLDHILEDEDGKIFIFFHASNLKQSPSRSYRKKVADIMDLGYALHNPLYLLVLLCNV
jgi:hypothetical protein